MPQQVPKQSFMLAIGRKVKEEHCPISFSVYRYMAKETMTAVSDHTGHAVTRLYLVLCWNLIARSVPVSSLMLQRITWKEDSMVIVFPTSKSDQEGNHCAPKHLYANIINPELCPVLSLAINIFTSGLRVNNARSTLFSDDSNKAEGRFGKWLSEFCANQQHLSYSVAFGCSALEVGTHSFRKRSSPMPFEYGAVAVYLRAVLDCSTSLL